MIQLVALASARTTTAFLLARRVGFATTADEQNGWKMRMGECACGHVVLVWSASVVRGLAGECGETDNSKVTPTDVWCLARSLAAVVERRSTSVQSTCRRWRRWPASARRSDAGTRNDVGVQITRRVKYEPERRVPERVDCILVRVLRYKC